VDVFVVESNRIALQVPVHDGGAHNPEGRQKRDGEPIGQAILEVQTELAQEDVLIVELGRLVPDLADGADVGT